MLEACRWLEGTWISAAIRRSQWGFALIEMMHLMALALLGAALLVTGLRVFGCLFEGRRPGAITRDLGWMLLGSFGAMIVSGMLLFADGPLRYYGNAAFRVKLLLVAGAAATAMVTHVVGVRTRVAAPVTKALALLSLSLWLGAGIAGRMIGVL